MAVYHLTAKIGRKGKAFSHAQYLQREGKYSRGAKYEDIEAKGDGNMPKWARENPTDFWKAADDFERKNGSVYRELEISLPRELSRDERETMARLYMREKFGDRHAYSWAIHNPKSKFDGQEQPHLHVMYSQRILDGHDRAPDQFFRRYNANHPERGGAKKDTGTKHLGQLRDELREERKQWAEFHNMVMDSHGIDAHIDHRTLEEQGKTHEAEPKIGWQRMRSMSKEEREQIQASRDAQQENEEAQQPFQAFDIDAALHVQHAKKNERQKNKLSQQEREQLERGKREARERQQQYKEQQQKLEQQRLEQERKNDNDRGYSR